MRLSADTSPTGSNAPDGAARRARTWAVVGLLALAATAAAEAGRRGSAGRGGTHLAAAQPPPDAPVVAAPAVATGAPARADESGPEEAEAGTLEEQRRHILGRMRRELALTGAQLLAVESIFGQSTAIGQGNPAITRHPMSRAECRHIRAEVDLPDGDPACGAANMVALFDPGAGQGARDASVCMDQYEFPNLTCEYPVVHVKAREAALLCNAIGKRLCDAHEWEGACAGAVRDPSVEYEWGRRRDEATWYHNFRRQKVWSYGPAKDHAQCATGGRLDPACPGGGFDRCPSNTYPAGAFPACRSAFGVFNQHGNVAEHMNLPIWPADLAKNDHRGVTEMKGSWFVFGATDAHPDDCRWRAPDWHATRVMSEGSHANYQLGFRCCKDLHEDG